MAEIELPSDGRASKLFASSCGLLGDCSIQLLEETRDPPHIDAETQLGRIRLWKLPGGKGSCNGVLVRRWLHGFGAWIPRAPLNAQFAGAISCPKARSCFQSCLDTWRSSWTWDRLLGPASVGNAVHAVKRAGRGVGVGEGGERASGDRD